MPPVDGERNEAFAAFALSAVREAGSVILPYCRVPISVQEKGRARGLVHVSHALQPH